MRFLLLLLLAISASAETVKTALETQPQAQTSAQVSTLDLNREGNRSFLIGHNVSPTSYTLPKGAATLGIYAAGYGFTDNFMIATSPWITWSYNMNNVHMRAAHKINSGQRVMLGLSYFKSYGEGYDFINGHRPYRQESVTAQLVHSFNVSPVYTVHSVVTYMGYMDDTAPYSLRMEPFSKDPSEIIVSTLHEARLTKRLGLNAELGILGLNYPYPYIHYGGSFVYISSRWLFQVGITHTMLLAGVSLPKEDGVTDRVHPEIQAQVFF